MGFLKNIFKRKKGGTLVGNLLRGVSSAATGGILGSGAGLAAWEAKQDQKELEQYRQAQLDGRQMGANLVNNVAVPAMASANGGNTPGGNKIGQSVFFETLKQKWYYAVGAVLAIGGGAYWIGNRKKGKKVK